MGDPRKKRKKYSTPKHPWQSERLEKEKILLENYALKNKKEIWKMQSVLKKYTNQAKRLVSLKTEQGKKEKEQMMGKLFRLGLVKKDADIDDVLGLTIENILDRRLQTLVHKRNMTNTPKQARQFIVHGHVFIKNQKMNVPSYLVKSDEENTIIFKEGSKLVGKFGVDEEEELKKVKLLKKASAKEKTEKETKDKPKKTKKVKLLKKASAKKSEKKTVKKVKKEKEETIEEKKEVKEETKKEEVKTEAPKEEKKVEKETSKEEEK
tara:strand:+ start:133 stop:927 length:795 start_codon:yes stop_codon:yes gene_type:complete